MSTEAAGSPSPPSVAGSTLLVSPSPTLEIDDGLARISFDDPARRLNVLDESVMHRLSELIDEVRDRAASGEVRSLLVHSGKPDSFIAGADVDAIAAIEDPNEGEEAAYLGQTIYLKLERLPIPTVAAIHGTCLGGGTEMALACRFRIVSDHPKTRIGLPEVQLGILPVWGGTTRLPRLVGLQAALPILLTGEPISGRKAHRIGFASEVFPAAQFDTRARQFARQLTDRSARPFKRKRGLIRRLGEDTAPGRRAILRVARRRVLAKTGGHYPAPLRILEVLRRHLGGPVGKSFEAEARAAGELIVSSVCKNLLHVFRLRERARKDPGVDAKAVSRSAESLGVVGAGVMGGGIAQLAAYHGLRVRMKDIRHEAVARGLEHARSLFDKAVSRKKLRPREAEQRMELVSGGLEYHGFGTLDVVVEAVVERIEVKRAVLKDLEAVVSDQALLVTNTSSLSIDGLAEGLDRPERFAGLHFFNPVHKMPLVEIVRGAETADDTIAALHRLAVDLGKVPVLCRDGPGFVVNRILGPYLNEAGWLLADGATIAEIDRAAGKFGMPMGPLRLIDEVGIDIANHAGHSLHSAFGARLAPAPALEAVAETGRLGRKGGRGFYVYDGGGEPEVDESVYGELGPAVPSSRGKKLDESEIRARLVLTMINEAARLLTERIVDRAGDVDLAMIMGTGFPPFRGGLLRFADTLHPRQIASRLETLAAQEGLRFEPSELILELAEKDLEFYDRFPG